MAAKNAAHASGNRGQSTEPSISRIFPEVAVLLLNEKGELCSISDEARSLLGVSPQTRALPAAVSQLIQEANSLNKFQASGEVLLNSAEGQVTRVNVAVQRLPGLAEESRLAVLLSANSQAADPENDLRHLHRLASAGTLSASMAHEIKNALIAGKSFVDLLLEKNQDSELVGIVRREMDRIDGLVSQMLRFSRPSRSSRAEVKVHDILDISLRLLQPQFRTKALKVDRQFHATSDLVKGNDQQLEQAFLNLLMNSMEAMGLEGQLTVSTAETQDAIPNKNHASGHTRWLEIRISDTGGGIAPEYLDHLFEPFFSTKKDGTGLGLAITRKIIKEHGGDISAESKPDEGATFRIRLPLAN